MLHEMNIRRVQAKRKPLIAAAKLPRTSTDLTQCPLGSDDYRVLARHIEVQPAMPPSVRCTIAHAGEIIHGLVGDRSTTDDKSFLSASTSIGLH